MHQPPDQSGALGFSPVPLLWRQTHVLFVFVSVSEEEDLPCSVSASAPSDIFWGEASGIEEVVFERATCGELFLSRKMSFRAPEKKYSTLLVCRSWLVTHFLDAFVSIVFRLNAGGVFFSFFLRLVFLSGHNKSNLSLKPLKHGVNRQKRLEKIWATAESSLPLC